MATVVVVVVIVVQVEVEVEVETWVIMSSSPSSSKLCKAHCLSSICTECDWLVLWILSHCAIQIEVFDRIKPPVFHVVTAPSHGDADAGLFPVISVVLTRWFGST